MKKSNLILIVLVSLVVIAARLVPHLPNFSPLASVLLFAGVYGRQKKYLILPLIALLVSDIFIGFYQWQIMLSVYLSLALIGIIGHYLKNHKNFLNIASGSLGGALLFFAVTNLAVWLFGNWYSHDLNGLALCYTLAIPFFKSTVLGNIFYSAILFGTYEFFSYLLRQKKLVFNK